MNNISVAQNTYGGTVAENGTSLRSAEKMLKIFMIFQDADNQKLK